MHAGITIAMGTAASLVCADLDGQTVTAEWVYPDFASVLESHDVLVGGDVELTSDDIVSDFKYAIDLSGDTVTFLFNTASTWTNVGINGWRFTDTNGTAPEITGYELVEASPGVGNFDQIVTGFVADSFWADFGGMTVANDGDYVVLQVQFAESCMPDINGDGRAEHPRLRRIPGGVPGPGSNR